jgi:hypothetical protein
MAESDPKKIRPFGQSSDRRHLDSEEDPLVELARIVSEDSGFYGSRAERPKPQREEKIERNAYSADLESELLQELESSFSRSTAPRVAPGAPHQAPQPAPPPLDDSDDLLRSIERQLGRVRAAHSGDAFTGARGRANPAAGVGKPRRAARKGGIRP